MIIVVAFFAKQSQVFVNIFFSKIRVFTMMHMERLPDSIAEHTGLV